MKTCCRGSREWIIHKNSKSSNPHFDVSPGLVHNVFSVRPGLCPVEITFCLVLK
jgi:hypothetical protein